jgi:lysophospholipase L1-like esterase
MSTADERGVSWSSRRVHALVASLLALTFAVGCAADHSAARLRIMPLGDSITDGHGIPGGYRIDLWRMLGARGIAVDFVGSLRNGPAWLPEKEHEGHSGWRIDQIQALVDASLRKYRPDVVLLLIGTNDILGHYRVGTAPERLGALVDQMAADRPAMEILVSTIPPTDSAILNRQVVRYNAAVRQVVRRRAAAGRPIWLVDGGGSLTRADLADGVHPNRTGYRKLARAWEAVPVRVLSPPRAATSPAETRQPALGTRSRRLSKHDALPVETRQ